ncbi:hypothetical protein [Deinococcus geothermalis]|nr:hypothetical protein [Deinococcus geothermalis]
MPFQNIVKLLVIVTVFGFSVSQAGASNHGIAHSTSPVSPQGANDYGIA